MNAMEHLAVHAANLGTLPAIVDPGWKHGAAISFQELDMLVNQVAQLLYTSGLRCGDRVVVFLPMSIELYASVLALLRLGLTAVFFDPALPATVLNERLTRIAPAALITGRKTYLYCAILSQSFRRIPLRFITGAGMPGTVNWYRAQQHRPFTGHPCITSDTPAFISLTSGSTGVAKEILRTHDFLSRQHRVLKNCFSPVVGQVELTALPMFVLANLAAGATSVLPDADLRRPAAIRPAPVIRQIRTRSITRILAPPAFLERLLEHCKATRLQLPEIEEIYTGGAPVFPSLMVRLRHFMPKADLRIVYGATEAEPIAMINTNDITIKDLDAIRNGCGLPAGHPVADIQCRVITDRWGEAYAGMNQQDLQRITRLPGHRGEIIVSGDHVLPDYPDLMANRFGKLVAGDTVWHRTGDAGYFDPNGRLWLLGRCAVSDRMHYPFEVEIPAAEFNGIRRAGYLCSGGRRILAVEWDPTVSKQRRSLVLAALRNLPVDSVEILKRVPVDTRHNSKVDYVKLARISHHCSSRDGARVRHGQLL